MRCISSMFSVQGETTSDGVTITGAVDTSDLVWSGVVALVAFKLVDLTIGLRVTEEAEREGLDTTSHGEAAYRM